MKAATISIGIVVLIIGAGVLVYGLSSPTTTTSTSTVTTSAPVVANADRVVSANGFWAMGAANLNQGEAVTGSVAISNFTSSAGPIFIYVQNESTFIAWGGCAPCGASNVLNQSLPSSGSYTLSFTAPKQGSYYFVLDADYYGKASPTTFSASGQTVQTSPISQSSPNSGLNYGGAIIATLGSVIIGAGIVMGARPPKPQPS